MNFDVNNPILFVIVAVIVLIVLAQSVYFLVMALKRAKAINMDSSKLKSVIKGSVIFTIVPAIAIVISVMTLSKDLGLPLPWLRLSVVGNLSYETIAASNAESAMGLVFGTVSSLTAKQYVTIAYVMTISIMTGIWLVPLFGEKLLNGMGSMEKRDKKWGNLFQNALFVGMLSAFLGYVFCDFSTVFHHDTSGLIPVCVFLVSALVMALAGILLKVKQWKWITDYALPLSMIIGMISAIPITAWLS